MADYTMRNAPELIDSTIDNALLKNQVKQVTGVSTTDLMSQKVITDELAKKVTSEVGKVLSTNDYTTAEKTKLAGLNNTTVVQTTGSSTTSIMSQKAVTDSLPTIVQVLGDSETDIMSQKAVKTALNGLTPVEILQTKGTSTTAVMSQKIVTDIVNACITNLNFTLANSILTATKSDGTTFDVDLQLNDLLKSGHYDDTNKNIVIVMFDNSELLIPVSDLGKKYLGSVGTDITVVVDDVNSTIKANIIDGSITIEKLATTVSDKLNSLVIDGDGLSFLANDGTYKPIESSATLSVPDYENVIPITVTDPTNIPMPKNGILLGRLNSLTETGELSINGLLVYTCAKGTYSGNLSFPVCSGDIVSYTPTDSELVELELAPYKSQDLPSTASVVQTKGTSELNVMSQKAVTDIVDILKTDGDGTKYLSDDGTYYVGGSTPVVQTKGDSETDVMSQKAVTDELNKSLSTTSSLINFFVSVDGDDDTGDGSMDNPYRTISKVISILPNRVDHSIYINLAKNGVYDGFSIYGMTGKGTLVISAAQYLGVNAAEIGSISISDIALSEVSISYLHTSNTIYISNNRCLLNLNNCGLYTAQIRNCTGAISIESNEFSGEINSSQSYISADGNCIIKSSSNNFLQDSTTAMYHNCINGGIIYIGNNTYNNSTNIANASYGGKIVFLTDSDIVPALQNGGHAVLKDGTVYGGGSDVTIVQTTGTSETDVMSQKAVTDELAKSSYSSTKEDINYFIDIVNGDDTTGDGTTENPFMTLTKAFSLLPDYINHTVIFFIKTEGDYGNIIIDGFKGSGSFEITIDDSTGDIYPTVGSVSVTNVSLPSLNIVACSSTSVFTFSNNSCSRMMISNCILNRFTANYCLGEILVQGCQFDGALSGGSGYIEAKNNTTIYSIYNSFLIYNSDAIYHNAVNQSTMYIDQPYYNNASRPTQAINGSKIVLQFDDETTPRLSDGGHLILQNGLLYVPELLREKPNVYAPRKSKTNMVAHRGMSGLSPENTLQSIHLAGAYGYHGCEFDIKETSDGYFVLMHDDTVDRTTDGTGTVSQMTLAQIRALHIDAGNGIEEFYDDTISVPTLEEALMVCNQYNMRPVVEIKSILSQSGSLPKLLSILNDYCDTNFTIIDFNESNLIKLRELDEYAELHYLVATPTIPNAGVCYVNKFVLSSSASGLTDEVIDYAIELNVKYGVWTVNDYTEVNTWKTKGAYYVTTDLVVDPTIMQKNTVDSLYVHGCNGTEVVVGGRTGASWFYYEDSKVDTFIKNRATASLFKAQGLLYAKFIKSDLLKGLISDLTVAFEFYDCNGYYMKDLGWIANFDQMVPVHRNAFYISLYFGSSIITDFTRTVPSEYGSMTYAEFIAKEIIFTAHGGNLAQFKV